MSRQIRITTRLLDTMPTEVRKVVMGQRKQIGSLETALGTAERTVRNQQCVIDALKRQIAEIQSRGETL